jgi:antitoxin MazE
MKARIIRIGRSSGIRIPKSLLEQTGLEGEVELIAWGDSLLIRPVVRPRAGWEESFAAMARRDDDVLLDDVEE